MVYRIYFKFVLPAVGRLISKDKSAYSYLPDSVSVFPEGKAFLDILRSAGYIKCTATPVSFGIASVYSGFKP
jgi:demethylmenaquinone methyltransferase / 2-methoxy-6-polyprenyl-1,4-benzoquinol methylase